LKEEGGIKAEGGGRNNKFGLKPLGSGVNPNPRPKETWQLIQLNISKLCSKIAK